jgi:hypothetical protein
VTTLLSEQPLKSLTSKSSSVELHPRFAAWLRRLNLDAAESLIDLHGEIICGHPDRHVVQIELPNQRVLFLKREHVSGWQVKLKNWWSGYGFVSRCARELATLKEIERLNLPGPQWLAHGSLGDGRSFLLIDSIPGSVDLHQFLAKKTLIDQRLVSARIGHAIAEFHDMGFATPDLSAKHIFIAGPTAAVSIIDWQSTPYQSTSAQSGSTLLASTLAKSPTDFFTSSSQPTNGASAVVVCWLDRLTSLARLNASINNAVSKWARFRLLREYLRACSGETPTFKDAVHVIERLSKSRSRKSTAMEQKAEGDSIRFVWLDGEKLVVTAKYVKNYSQISAEILPHQSGKWKTFDPLGRAWSWFRGQPWRSPAANAARLLAQLQKANVPSPRLIAYGQELKSFGRANSFVYTDQAYSAALVSVNSLNSLNSINSINSVNTFHSANSSAISEEILSKRKQRIARMGELLAKAHQAGAAIREDNSSPIFLFDSEVPVQLNTIPAFLREKKLRKFRIAADLINVIKVHGVNWTKTDRLRFVRAYCTHANTRVFQGKRMLKRFLSYRENNGAG